MNDLLEAARGLARQHGLSETDAEALAAVMAQCTERWVSAGDIICKEGEEAGELFFLLEGAVRVSKRDYLGNEKNLAVLLPPALLGHMALVSRSPRTATCTAEGATRLACLSRRTFDALLKDVGDTGDVLRRLVLSSMSRQLARGNDDIRRLIRTGGAGGMDVGDDDLLQVTGALDGWRR